MTSSEDLRYLGERIDNLREAADTLRAELDNERSKRLALESRLNLIEQKGRN